MSETELKLLLPGADVAHIAEQLARHPALRRRPRQVQRLHNVYYDTPDQALRRQKVALRVRRQTSGEPPKAQWILTLKTAGTSVGGLSQRGEWESLLPNARPRLSALQGTPWATLDPDGTLWPQLAPAFVTTCTRTLWLLRQRGGSVIEVALDVGEILAGGRRETICELELELKAGPPEALHALARRLADTVAVLPGQASKAERGYALARNEAALPTRARPVTLVATMPVSAALTGVLAEMWDQTLRNSAWLPHSDDAELLHQARVGWRRLRSVTRLLRPLWGTPPATPALRAFWQATGPVRELDVMLTDTLPAWAQAYAGSDPQRQAEWATMLDAVRSARTQAATAMRVQLAQPATGQGWLAWGEWLTALAEQPVHAKAADWPVWVAKRLDRQHARLKQLGQSAHTDAERHALRLRAKRLRYGAEAFASVLPKRRARRWQQDAGQAQLDEGRQRDLRQCVLWLERLAVPNGPLAFMRGVCQGLLSR
ncbi:MAG: CHAD domain-containing protein [Hydrogenophaga sp.]|nr:CHAD domain-containing protein [Hydrogenophaga sp.]